MRIAVVLCTLTIAVVSVECANLPLTTTESGCTYQGRWYPEGPFQADPCSPCHCRDGRVACADVDCFFTQCVDPVRDPGQCCPVCPNGPNCRAPDGTIIPAGQVVSIDLSTTCHCGHAGLGFMGPNNAICTTIIKPQ